MRTRSLLTIVAMMLSLTAAFGPSVPVVVAQEATPVAVAPPQDLLPATADYGTGETAEINGIDIYYEVYGEGRGPGALAAQRAGQWGSLCQPAFPPLTDQHEVVVMDSRGHGRSSFDDTPISYEVMASDVLALMDHLGIDKASIVGWSDGGIIGLELAIHHPER